jgi:glycosyltransferase involved in cell wall biosynthesis
LQDIKNALLAEPGNPQDIALKIEKLLLNRALGEKLASQAFFDVQEYTWRKRADRILNSIFPMTIK